MKRSIRGLIISTSIFILIIFIVFIINQTVQVINLAKDFHYLAGQIAFWGLLALYFILLAVPIYYFLRLPKALTIPETEDSKAFDKYVIQLAGRLRKNTLLQGYPMNTRSDIEAALKILDTRALNLIKQYATTVFVTTAISQSGRLDTLTVLVAQIRMVWNIAKIYYQRPVLREVLQLYANVAGTAFIAGELNDVDVSQQVDPIVTNVLGSTLTNAIPGVNMVAGIVSNSLLSGSANAYLTLRIGAIAKQYSGMLVKKERWLIRRSASVEAARLLSVIVMGSAGTISKAIINAAVKSPGKFSSRVIKSTWGRMSGKGRVTPEVSPDLK